MNSPTSLSLGYSTCPNDTFLFHALAHGLVACPDTTFSIALEDVETLNQKARKNTYDISKLSFAAIGNLLETYALLRSGSALGRGCGPLIVARPGAVLKDLPGSRIAVPGMWTTAFLLLTLYLEQKPSVIPMTFDQIMPALQKGTADFGVIIHEGRFTFPEYGLVELLDLGQWWEQTTGKPIPLGGIAIQRRLGSEKARTVDMSIRASVQAAMAQPEKSNDYVRRYAQEMEPETIQRHIDLYVNAFTVDLGAEGTEAVETLFSMARQIGAIADSSMPIFAY